MRVWAKLLLFMVPLAAVCAALMTMATRRAVIFIEVEGVRARAQSLGAGFHAPAALEGLTLRSETRLLPFLQLILKGGAAYAAVQDDSGRVIAHTDVARVGSRMADEAFQEALSRRRMATRRLGTKDERPLLEAVLPVRAHRPQGDELLLLGGQTAPVIGVLRVAMPLDEALETAERISRRVLASLALIVLLGLALSLLFLRAVLRPVALLGEAARRIGSGALGERVPVLSSDELGALSRAFNDMSGALVETTVSKRFLDGILESMVDGLVVADAAGRIRLINPSAVGLLGGGAGSWLGRPASDLFSDPDLRSSLPKRLKGEQAAAFETVLGQGASAAAVLCGVAPLIGGESGAFVLTFHDITRRKRAEDELARSNAELEQFAFIASHDLQEPLRKVSSYCQLLQKRYRGKLDQDADDFMRYAVEGAARMRQLITDLLTYSRVGRLDHDWGRTDLAAALDRALEDLSGALESEGAKVVRGDLPVVPGSLSQLAQLFQNLIGNALKFRGKDPPLVQVSAARGRDEWQVTVKDNGIGIEPRHQEKIFAMFQRLHGSKEYPGSGIGLAICRKIVERHGGRLWVDSKPGEGSAFHFTLRAQEEDGHEE